MAGFGEHSACGINRDGTGCKAHNGFAHGWRARRPRAAGAPSTPNKLAPMSVAGDLGGQCGELVDDGLGGETLRSRMPSQAGVCSKAIRFLSRRNASSTRQRLWYGSANEAAGKSAVSSSDVITTWTRAFGVSTRRNSLKAGGTACADSCFRLSLERIASTLAPASGAMAVRRPTKSGATEASMSQRISPAAAQDHNRHAGWFFAVLSSPTKPRAHSFSSWRG